MNRGLDSRFCWRFHTEKYNAGELQQIFQRKVKNAKWSLNDDAVNEDWFINNNHLFPAFGRDIEILFSKVKIAHGRRIFTKSKSEKTKINNDDINNGLKLFIEHRKHTEKNKKDNLDFMYT